MLSESLLPDSDIDIIRTYSRHRLNIINESASCVKRMQKFLRLMNMRLEVVVKDIVGLTGIAIIKAFINGETDSKRLAANRHYNCKKSKTESAKQFKAWLRLAPNNKISGGKVLSHHLPKGSSCLKIAFRNAANAILQLKEGSLVDFFKKINYRKGRICAVSALARKLAVIVWNMITKGQNYNSPIQYLFLNEKRKLGIVKRTQKQITKFEINELV